MYTVTFHLLNGQDVAVETKDFIPTINEHVARLDWDNIRNITVEERPIVSSNQVEIGFPNSDVLARVTA